MTTELALGVAYVRPRCIFNTQCIAGPREDSLESPQAPPLACQRCARITRVHYVQLINRAAWSVFIAARAIVAQGMHDMILGHFGSNGDVCHVTRNDVEAQVDADVGLQL